MNVNKTFTPSISVCCSISGSRSAGVCFCITQEQKQGTSMLANATDELLFRSIKAGDPYAFRILVDKYCDALLSHCLSYLKRKDVAEEVVSDVFLALWAKKDGIFINTSLKSYLYTTARNHSINYLRAHKKELSYEDISADFFSGKEHIDNLEYEYDEHLKTLYEQLEKMLEVLPPRQKKIFLLYKDGWKHKEIAQMMSLSEKTVRNQVERAVRQLKDMVRRPERLSPLMLLLLII